MVDPKKAAELIHQHFAELTTEKFVENLHRSCPEIFEDNQQLASRSGEAQSQIPNSSSFISSSETKSQKPISKPSH